MLSSSCHICVTSVYSMLNLLPLAQWVFYSWFFSCSACILGPSWWSLRDRWYLRCGCPRKAKLLALFSRPLDLGPRQSWPRNGLWLFIIFRGVTFGDLGFQRASDSLKMLWKTVSSMILLQCRVFVSLHALMRALPKKVNLDGIELLNQDPAMCYRRTAGLSRKGDSPVSLINPISSKR